MSSNTTFRSHQILLLIGVAILGVSQYSPAHAASFPTGTLPQSVAVGDVNGDSIDDIVVANQTDNTVSVLIGNGDGTFKPAVAYSTGAGTSPIGVALGILTA